MRLKMRRVISQDSSSGGSAPNTPGSADILNQSHPKYMWRESKMFGKQSLDECSDSSQDGDPPFKRKIRNSASEGNLSNSSWDEERVIPTQDVDTHLLQKLDPRTKFDDCPAMVTGVTFKNNGDLVVSDAENHKVKCFDVRTGQLKIECSVGSNQATLRHPCGVTVLKKTDQILVTDTENSDVKLFTRDGRYLASFGRDLQRPKGIAALPNGNVVVTDVGSNKVVLYQNLSEKGVVDLTSEIENGCQGKLGQPAGISASGDGAHLVICDAKTNSVLNISVDGQLLKGYYTPTGSAEDQGSISPGFLGPGGLSQEWHANTVLVADTGNSRVVRLDLDSMTLTRVVLSSQVQQGQTKRCQVTEPELIAVGPDGLLAVVERQNRGVVKIYRYMK